MHSYASGAEGRAPFAGARDDDLTERYRRRHRRLFAAFPDSYTEIVNVLGDGEWAALEWRGGGTHLGDFAGVAATGRTFELRGCGFFRIPAAAVVCQRGYWDKVAWFGQLGLPLD